MGLLLNPVFIEFFTSPTFKDIVDFRSDRIPLSRIESPSESEEASLVKVWLAQTMGERIRDGLEGNVRYYHHQPNSSIGVEALKRLDQVNLYWKGYTSQIDLRISDSLTPAGLYFQLLDYFSSHPQ